MPRFKVLGGDFDTKRGTYADGCFILLGKEVAVASLQSLEVETPTPKKIGGWGMGSELNPLGIAAASLARFFGPRKRNRMQMTFVATLKDGRKLRGSADGVTIGEIHAAYAAAQQ